jgi:hypothetical protein
MARTIAPGARARQTLAARPLAPSRPHFSYEVRNPAPRGREPGGGMTTPSTPKSAPALALSLLAIALFAPACLDQDETDALDEEEDGLATIELRATGSELDAVEVCPNILNDGIGLMRYCRNRNIYTDNASVERAIIVIHGSGLDAKEYYDKTVAEALAEGVDLGTTDIIAPQFFEGTAQTAYPSTGTWTNYYRWNSTWRWGHLSPSHDTRSSFAMVDHIIGQLMDHRPNLEMIVVAGQSAGGQFVDRYAVGTTVDHTGVEMRFWAANPSTNVWYTSTRPAATCAGHNDYGYGLDSLNTYMGGSTAAQIRSRALTRDIFWTVGENDTGTAGLDVSCKADATGANRNERWDNHRTHVADLCAAQGYSGLYCLFHSARHIEIPGCGHGKNCSWESDEGHEILFGS